MNAPSAASFRRPRTGSIIVLVVGAILTLAGPVVGVLAGSVAMIPDALNLADHTTKVAPTGAVALDAAESVYLLGPVTHLDRLDHDSCTAIGPGGEPAAVAFAPASALNTLVSGTRYESFAQLTARTAGGYEITCRVGDIPVIAAPPVNVAGLLGPLAGWFLAGVAISVVGIALVIIGIVRLARAPRAN